GRTFVRELEGPGLRFRAPFGTLRAALDAGGRVHELALVFDDMAASLRRSDLAYGGTTQEEDGRRVPLDELTAAATVFLSEAIDLYLGSDVIDLHVDSFIWTRIFGYDLTRRHGRGLLGACFYSQVDLPRLREARVTGGIWVITTNPLRGAEGRAAAFAKNLQRLRAILQSCENDVALVRTAAEYRAAVAAGKHAAFLGIQGGNA